MIDDTILFVFSYVCNICFQITSGLQKIAFFIELQFKNLTSSNTAQSINI